MSAMNAPVCAALAPGVLVVGRIVSAISSSRSMSWTVNSPIGDRSGRGGRSARGEPRAPPTTVSSEHPPTRDAAYTAIHRGARVARDRSAERVAIRRLVDTSSWSVMRDVSGQRLRRLSSFTAWSAARAVSAMYVSDGFWHADDAMHEPSVTKTFGASHTWFHELSTDDFGSAPCAPCPSRECPCPGSSRCRTSSLPSRRTARAARPCR